MGQAARLRTALHDGLTRTALVHTPAGAAGPRPVVLNLHGGGGNADSHRAWTRMDAAADRRGFVAVHPNGTGGIAGKLLVWNAGTCCGRAPTRGVDDAGFLVRLLDALEARVLHPAVEDSVGRWRSFDGCPETPRVAPAITGSEGHTATRLSWGPCRDGVEVVLWRLTGAGHVWPGAESFLPALLGPPTTVLDANEEMWRFFERFRRG